MKLLSQLQIVVLIALTGHSHTTLAQYIDDHTRTATDAVKGDVFIQNPAAIFPGKTWITYTQATTKNDYHAVANVNNTTDDRHYKVNHSNHGLGILYPLGGGAAFGFVGQQLGRDLEATTTNRTTTFEEVFRSKHLSARFILDITSKVRGGFAYRVTEEKVDVLGEFDIAANDRTKYTGKMTGYVMGVFYEDSKYGFGIGHAPGLRGKADVQGEEKIVTQRGVTVVDAFYKDTKTRYGLVYQKWKYQRDDRAEQVQSLNDQRNMSLNGLDFEQFLFANELLLLGLDYPFNNQTFLTLSLGRHKSVFLFDGDVVPGDDPDTEEPLTHYSAKVGITYEKNDFKFSAIYSMTERALDNFRDSDNWLSASQYESYSAKESTISISAGFVN